MRRLLWYSPAICVVVLLYFVLVSPGHLNLTMASLATTLYVQHPAPKRNSANKDLSGSLAYLGLLLTPSASSACVPTTNECVMLCPQCPMQVTPDCIDPLYSNPIWDNEVDELSPVPHRRISGHFNGTEVDFNIYLPPKETWQGRFFQHVYPTQDSSADDRAIAWGAEAGGFTVQARGVMGYRADAALAKLSRQVAREHYGALGRNIYGYIYGASGGSVQTIGAVENTFGVWDGAVALVLAAPMGNINSWAMRTLGGFVLGDKSDIVRDAVAPGGRDPLGLLTETERSVLKEVTALGVPYAAWEDFEGVGMNRTLLWGSMLDIVIPFVKSADPSYVDDFWSAEGYVGTENSGLGDFFRAALVEFNTTVQEVVVNDQGQPVLLTLEEVPRDISPLGLNFTVISNSGSTTSVSGRLDVESRHVYLNPTDTATLERGAQVKVDNRWFLAVQTYYRHQVPPVDQGSYAFDYLRQENGEPRYPQRSALLGPSLFHAAGGGGSFTGNITSKMMVVDTLLDYDAFPWHADWYKSQVARSLGDEALEDNFRLYFGENADHFQGAVALENQHRLVDYTPLYERHLVELSRWVEKGVEPAAASNYTVVDGQVLLQGNADTRGGIQPVVSLTVDGGALANIMAGGQVKFDLLAEVPASGSSIVAVEWDFDGTGDFVDHPDELSGTAARLQVSHTYQVPGTYIAGVRVTSREDGDEDTPYSRPINLGRVRVVVE